MSFVLRAGVPLAIVAAFAATAPTHARPPAAVAPAPSGAVAPEACADGVGGRWVFERAAGNEANDLRLTHVGIDDVPEPALTVRRVHAARGLSAQLRCDGRGGAWLAWTEIDYATMTTEVRVAHVGPDGELLARGDDALASFFDLFDAVSLLADGRGGVYVAWRATDENHERRVRLCRLTADGRAAAGWPAGGLALAQPRGNVRPHLVTDGEGGAIVVSDADPNEAGGTAFALRVSPGAALLH